MAEHQGFIRNAFHRKDNGDIALIWGDDKKGLCHIIKRRKETNKPVRKLLLALNDVIQHGSLERGDKNEFQIKYKGKTVIVVPTLDGDNLQFILSAFYDR